MDIRRANACDIERINELLFQVAKIHAEGRPDIFKQASKKYTDEQLLEIIDNNFSPIFVAVIDERVVGYAFCIYQSVENSQLLKDKKTLYIDDICVDENKRGKGIGASLYDHVISFAKANGFDNVTLNVWAFNEDAYKFYQKHGMTNQKIIMEKTLK